MLRELTTYVTDPPLRRSDIAGNDETSSSIDTCIYTYGNDTFGVANVSF